MIKDKTFTITYKKQMAKAVTRKVRMMTSLDFGHLKLAKLCYLF